MDVSDVSSPFSLSQPAPVGRPLRGARLGRPAGLPDTVRQRIAAERADGRSLRDIADTLNTEAIPTARGGRWHASTVRLVLASLDLDAEAARRHV